MIPIRRAAMWARARSCAAVLVWMLVPVAPASALTTLTAKFTDVSCQVSGPSGIEARECRTIASSSFYEIIGFFTTIAPGQTAEARGFIDYSYSDDGLPLTSYQEIQMNPFGILGLPVDHEVGALYAMSSNCASRYCIPPGGVSWGGNTGYPPLVLGLNDSPDQLSGRIPVSGSVSVQPGYLLGTEANVYVQWLAITYSGVAPIPEPATFLLVVVGLGAVGWRVAGSSDRSQPRAM